MGKNSAIEWTHHTFNPWWGCTKVSQACKLCYAEVWARRTGGNFWGPRASRRFFGDHHWKEPFAWNDEAAATGQRFRVFCASMADVFEYRAELHPWREKLWDLIERTTSLDWLLLTKRPQRMVHHNRWGGRWPSNVWLGTTVENQKTADERIPHLLDNSAPVRFLSCEPLVGPIDVSRYLSAGLEWVIAGGESGGKSRPSHPQWFRNLRDQCIDADVPFLFKQWGNWSPLNEGVAGPRIQVHMFADGEAVCRHNKKEAGRLLDGRTWDDVPVIVHDRSIGTVRTTPAQQEIHSRL
jgi:protein gp37